MNIIEKLNFILNDNDGFLEIHHKDLSLLLELFKEAKSNPANSTSLALIIDKLEQTFPVNSSLVLEVGKQYYDRDFDIWEIVKQEGGIFRDSYGNSYTESGKYAAHIGTPENRYDLVSEYLEGEDSEQA
jgi:hypothetical protein